MQWASAVLRRAFVLACSWFDSYFLTSNWLTLFFQLGILERAIDVGVAGEKCDRVENAGGWSERPRCSGGVEVELGSPAACWMLVVGVVSVSELCSGVNCSLSEWEESLCPKLSSALHPSSSELSFSDEHPRIKLSSLSSSLVWIAGGEEGVRLGYDDGRCRVVDDVMLGPKSSSKNTEGLNGEMPVFRNALIINSCVIAFFQTTKYSGMKLWRSIVIRWAARSPEWAFQVHCRTEKTPTSSGWSLWVVFNGRQNKTILLSYASRFIAGVSWDSWPSNIRRMGFLSSTHQATTFGIKLLQNYISQSSLSVHPESDFMVLVKSKLSCEHARKLSTHSP